MTLPTAELRKRRRARGQCLWCASAATAGVFCSRHAEINRQQRRAWRQAHKETMNHSIAAATLQQQAASLPGIKKAWIETDQYGNEFLGWQTDVDYGGSAINVTIATRVIDGRTKLDEIREFGEKALTAIAAGWTR